MPRHRLRRSVPGSVLLVAALTAGVASAAALQPPEPLAAVAWPVSGGLLVAEIVTGGPSASDEYVEIHNAGATDAPLDGLELAYVTATGTTITRKQSWTGPAVIPPGRHLLLANAAGSFAALADGTYSGGFAATGGALVLRPVGGSPIDALAWGDATNAFVEGVAAPAPPTGQSVERRPGGLDGNGVDTNDNAADTRLEALPAPQNLAAPPVPAPQPSSTAPPATTPWPTQTGPPATASLAPSPSDASPTPSAGPTDTAIPDPTATAEITASPTASQTSSPTPVVTATPMASPTASASPPPMPTATATTAPSPAVQPIAVVRARSLGSAVIVEGTLTTPLGLVDAGDGAFVQDGSGGIALYLSTADWPPLAVGGRVRATGELDSRYGQLTIRLASGSALVDLGLGAPIDPESVATGAATEALEGRLVSVEGTTIGAVDTLSDGLATTIDDGSGPLRVVAPTASGLTAADLAPDRRLRLSGVLGQRDSSGTGIGGYRLYLRSPADLLVLPTPTPSPTASGPATPTPGPTATGSGPSPSPSRTPVASPTSPPLVSIATIRGLPLDTPVAVSGIVTAETGPLIDDRTFVIQDGGGGICVRLDGSWRASDVARGELVTIHGRLGQRYGNLEVRVGDGDSLLRNGSALLPPPLTVEAREIGEALEGRLVRLTGSVTSVSASATGSLTLLVDDGDVAARVFAHAALGLDPSRFRRGQTLQVTGIVGQRGSTGGAPSHRLWPRDATDLLILSAPGGSLPPGGSPTPPGGQAPVIPIRAALARDGEEVAVEGTVTAAPGLLDADGRRVTIEDATAGLLVRLPAGGQPLHVGERIRIAGTMGTYLGAPQLATDSAATVVGHGQPLARRIGIGPIAGSLEWRLVEVSGRVVDVQRYGAAWRAEIGSASGRKLPIQGTARSGIPSTALVEGRIVTATGLVRRPHPSATDRRFFVLPRSSADIRLGPPVDHGGAGSGTTAGGSGGSAKADGRRGNGRGDGTGVPATTPIDVDLADLAMHAGELVRVGGIVVALDGVSLQLDDGTATASARVPEEAREAVAALERGEAVNVTGHVVADADGAWIVAARSAADVARVGDLGELRPLATTASDAAIEPGAASATARAGAPPPPVAMALTGLATLGGALLLAGLFGHRALRRRHAERSTAARIGARLSLLMGARRDPGALPAGHSDAAERGSLPHTTEMTDMHDMTTPDRVRQPVTGP